MTAEIVAAGGSGRYSYRCLDDGCGAQESGFTFQSEALEAFEAHQAEMHAGMER